MANKILLLFDKIAKLRMKVGLWLAGFRNIKEMKIICGKDNLYYTYFIDGERNIHTIMEINSLSHKE